MSLLSRIQLLGMLLVGFFARNGVAQKPAGRYIIRDEEPIADYQALMASFGNQLEEDTTVNLMFPPTPQDRQLCEYPPTLIPDSPRFQDEDYSSLQERARSIEQPIAVAVAIGGCPTEQKAEVMLALQANWTQQIRILIVYETSPLHPNWFLSLAPEREIVPPEFQNVAIMYVPFKHTRAMVSSLYGDDKHVANANPLPGDPFLLSPNNFKWKFEHSIKDSWTPIDVNDYDTNRGVPEYEFDGNDDFYWIRYVLFSLLILSPCFRAGYLFYAGGGRLQFRRNDNGRITGVQYIPPMPYWLSHGRPPHQSEPVSEALTEEQFENLPEIIYMPIEEVLSDEDGNQAAVVEVVETDEEDDDDEEVDVIVNVSGSDDPELGKVGSLSAQGKSVASSDSAVVVPPTPNEALVIENTEEAEAEPSLAEERCSSEHTPDRERISPTTRAAAAAESTTANATGPSSGGFLTGSVGTGDCASVHATTVSPTTVSPSTHAVTTVQHPQRCTECSICIDDFEPGERLIVLPRCQHAFHKECIRPWLLERQGRCPLCKTAVLQDNDNRQTDSDASGSSLASS